MTRCLAYLTALFLIVPHLVACEGYVSGNGANKASEQGGGPPGDGTGGGGGTDGTGGGGGGGVDEVTVTSATVTPGVRRLTNFEYRRAIADLFGPDAVPEGELASPTGSTYGNATEMQAVTKTVIENAEANAKHVAKTALPDLAAAEALMGCSPQDAEVASCYESFVRNFGRRVLRRPLSDVEVGELVALGMDVADPTQPLSGPRLILEVLLQHAEFLYRKEIGELVDGYDRLFRLDDFEIATRMAFLLWGSTPDEELLRAAEAGELSTSDGRRSQAQRMLYGSNGERAKAVRRVQRFHSLWLGYFNVNLPGEIAAQARQETDALIERVLFDEKAQWNTLFIYDKTFVGPELAAHYELEHPGGQQAAWIDYESRNRAGILSHASFLNTATTSGKTSPTHRGKHIYERLFCGHIPPPPGNINPDEQHIGKCGDDGYCTSPANATDFACETDADCPESLACKSEHSAFYLRPDSGCAGCHVYMDPIGLGLENFDHTGAYRTQEEEKHVEEGMSQPTCTIEGQGKAPGLGEFRGPGELGQLLAVSDEATSCMSRQFYQFAWGLNSLPSRSDEGASQLHALLEANDRRLLETLIELVASEAFALRRAPFEEESEEPEEPVELREGVDMGIVAVESPSIDADCSELSALDPIAFTHADSGFDNTAECRVSWNGDADAPRLHGCCTVQDDNLEAVLSAGETGDIWNDDGMAFLIGPPVAEKTATTFKAEVNINGAHDDSLWPDGKPAAFDGNIESKVVQRADGYTVEWSIDIAADLQADRVAACNFRNNDRDNGEAHHSHAFGELLLKAETFGRCQFIDR